MYIVVEVDVDVHAEALENACDVLRGKLGLAEETVDYLRAYRYGAELIRRIADAVTGG